MMTRRLGKKMTAIIAAIAVAIVAGGITFFLINNSGDKSFYAGDDLGATYSANETKLRVWAPTADGVQVNIYVDGGDTLSKTIDMASSVNGTWTATLAGDQNGTVYTYVARFKDEKHEAVDPYARAVTVNGDRGVIVDLSKTNPAKWTPTVKPAFSGNAVDATFYELHVRDLSMDASSGIPVAHQGKFLGLTDWNTGTPQGGLTGMSAIKDLGVSHVQLLPIFDYASVDETDPTFNWGYDPKNYNAPEGSYSTDPVKPATRITEMKTAVQSLHDHELRVVMDVVYNHVFDASSFSFEQLVPGYFFRLEPDGTLANGSACGNEVASEKPMVRKFIVDSVKYWASQYNLDGFRFDLMGLMDVKTINQIRAELDKIDPSILMIGEGWNMGDVLSEDQRATQINAAKMPGVSFFNDEIRDGVKGSVFEASQSGYATGDPSMVDKVKPGISGQSADAAGAWSTVNPGQSVNYIEAHDNNTVFDKLLNSRPDLTGPAMASVFRFASSIPILAQGLPFIHAGQEFMRTKFGDENSYSSGDETNSLKWGERSKNQQTVNYFKGLLRLRSEHPAFRLSTAADVKSNLKFLEAPDNAIAYSLNGAAVNDSWSQIVVIHNPSTKVVEVNLPLSGDWQIVVDSDHAGIETIKVLNSTNKVKVPAASTMVLHK